MSDQTRLVSILEVCMGTAIGYVVSFLLWPVVAHIYHLPYSYQQNFGITGIFTVASLIRGYVVRRYFANGMHQVAINLARRFI